MPSIMVALSESSQDGGLTIRAPTVGRWTELPLDGALLGPGCSIGCLSQLQRRFRLELPRDVSGRIVERLPRARAVDVEYGQTLFRLEPIGLSVADGTTARARRDEAATSGIPPGTRAIVSPTDGVFYRSPSPEAPPFIELGSRVRHSDPIGLVEVMKTFNQICYEGATADSTAEIVEIRCGDLEEVLSGQLLVVVRESS